MCVAVANRLVIPSLPQEELPKFASGKNILDRSTKEYIHTRFEYQFAVVNSIRDMHTLEMQVRDGTIFGVKPLPNPA